MSLSGKRTVAGRLISPRATRSAAGRLVSAGGELGSPLYYAKQYGLLLWLRADVGVQYGATLRATGTSPPAVTISGTPTAQAGLHIEIDSVAGGTGLGQATFKWSTNNGTSYVATGVTTSASVALGTTGITASFAAGPYNVDNKWDITVAQWSDQSGNANHATQTTTANQPKFSLAGYGGYSAVDWGTGTTFGFTTPSLTIGPQLVIAAVRGDASCGYLFVGPTNDVPGGYVLGGNNRSAYLQRGANGSSRVYSDVTFMRDAVRRTVARSINGTHASHKLYYNGVDLAMASGPETADPGTSTVTGVCYVGSSQTISSSFRGLIREMAVFGSQPPDAIVLALHQGMAARASGAI
jgi:hypothetical protein